MVETNTEVVHWAVRRCGADTVIGKDHQGVLLTLVERVTKYVLIVKLDTKEAAPLAKAAVRAIAHCGLPSLTIPTAADRFDNDKEFSRHEQIGLDLSVAIYFADPHSLWQRGLNENTNTGPPVRADPAVYFQRQLD